MVLGSPPPSCFGEFARRTHIIVLTVKICHRREVGCTAGSAGEEQAASGPVGRRFMSLLHRATQLTLAQQREGCICVVSFLPQEAPGHSVPEIREAPANFQATRGDGGSAKHTCVQTWHHEQPLCQ